ncbi:MAG: hypothetical protein HY429_02140 [Candidatus Levybacteria bacterium]|nr:hypothetical protein [Candidatus Levybacteria bacterium]
MEEKITGNILLITGIVIMLFSTVRVILVFSGTVKPIQFYKAAPKSVQSPVSPSQTQDLNALLKQQDSNVDLAALLAQSSGNVNPLGGIEDLFSSSDFLNGINLMIELFLMGFIANFGYKLANLGVQLIRPVYVKYKVKEEQQMQAPKISSS